MRNTKFAIEESYPHENAETLFSTMHCLGYHTLLFPSEIYYASPLSPKLAEFSQIWYLQIPKELTWQILSTAHVAVVSCVLERVEMTSF